MPTESPSPSPNPLSLRERAARLLLVGFKGPVLRDDHWIVRAVAEDGLGGVILFARNIESAGQLEALTGALRAAAGSRRLLIAVDQEGGAVARLNPENGYPLTPSAAKVGRDYDAAQTAELGRQVGSMLSGAGINFNLAPVVDLNVNPDNPSIGALGRSYSDDPEVVVELASSFIGGMHEAGVLATVKHFPGLGSATGDTDREFVDISETWSESELAPFARLCADRVTDAVMVANALNGQLDPGYPASLSAPTLDLLRGQLGWDGVAITDDLQAGALAGAYQPEQIARLALAAGNDLLLYANTQLIYRTDIVSATLDTIVDLVDRGVIAEERIDQSLARIERMLG